MANWMLQDRILDRFPTHRELGVFFAAGARGSRAGATRKGSSTANKTSARGGRSPSPATRAQSQLKRSAGAGRSGSSAGTGRKSNAPVSKDRTRNPGPGDIRKQRTGVGPSSSKSARP